MDMDQLTSISETRQELLARVANDNLALAVAQNIAANGRLFCALIFAAHIAAYLKTGSPLFAVLAAVSALPVGLSVIADQAAFGPGRSALRAAIYGLATIAAFAFVFAILLG